VNSKGVLYLSLGAKTHELTRQSINSLRKYNDVPIAVVTDKPELFQDCDWVAAVEGISKPMESRRYKTQIGRATPFEKTLFLDSDTLVYGDVTHLFEIDGLALVPSNNQNPTISDEAKDTFKLCEGIKRYNTGVIIYNQSHVELFDSWHEEWSKHKHVDELAFMRALKTHNTPVIELGDTYNSKDMNNSIIYHAYDCVKYIMVNNA
jgi:hypothetical protein